MRIAKSNFLTGVVACLLVSAGTQFTHACSPTDEAVAFVAGLVAAEKAADGSAWDGMAGGLEEQKRVGRATIDAAQKAGLEAGEVVLALLLGNPGGTAEAYPRIQKLQGALLLSMTPEERRQFLLGQLNDCGKLAPGHSGLTGEILRTWARADGEATEKEQLAFLFEAVRSSPNPPPYGLLSSAIGVDSKAWLSAMKDIYGGADGSPEQAKWLEVELEDDSWKMTMDPRSPEGKARAEASESVGKEQRLAMPTLAESPDWWLRAYIAYTFNWSRTRTAGEGEALDKLRRDSDPFVAELAEDLKVARARAAQKMSEASAAKSGTAKSEPKAVPAAP